MTMRVIYKGTIEHAFWKLGKESKKLADAIKVTSFSMVSNLSGMTNLAKVLNKIKSAK